MTEARAIESRSFTPNQPICSCRWAVLSGVLSCALIVIGVLSYTPHFPHIATISQALPAIMAGFGVVGVIFSYILSREIKSDQERPSSLPVRSLNQEKTSQELGKSVDFSEVDEKTNAEPKVIPSQVPAEPSKTLVDIEKSNQEPIQLTRLLSFNGDEEFLAEARKWTQRNELLQAISKNLIPVNGLYLLEKIKKKLSKNGNDSEVNAFLERLKNGENSELFFTNSEDLRICLECQDPSKIQGTISLFFGNLEVTLKNPVFHELSTLISGVNLREKGIILREINAVVELYHQVIGEKPQFNNGPTLSPIVSERWKDALLRSKFEVLVSEPLNEDVAVITWRQDLVKGFNSLFSLMNIDASKMTKNEVALYLTKTPYFLHTSVFWNLVHSVCDGGLLKLINDTFPIIQLSEGKVSCRDLMKEVIELLFKGPIDDSNVVAADILSILIYYHEN